MRDLKVDTSHCEVTLKRLNARSFCKVRYFSKSRLGCLKSGGCAVSSMRFACVFRACGRRAVALKVAAL